jgi:hypothetical protein
MWWILIEIVAVAVAAAAAALGNEEGKKDE